MTWKGNAQVLGDEQGIIGIVDPRAGVVQCHRVVDPIAHENANDLVALLLKKPGGDTAVDATGKADHHAHGAKLTPDFVVGVPFSSILPEPGRTPFCERRRAPGQPMVNRFVNSPTALPGPDQLRDWICPRKRVSKGQQHDLRGLCAQDDAGHSTLLPGEQEALDVLQDGFLKVFGNIGGYTFRGSFEGWMRRIMVHMAIDALRANKQLQWVGENEEMLDVLSEPSDGMRRTARNGPD